MPTINQGWYDANAGRSYPVDERATQLDDTGLRLPSHLLVDAHLRFPQSLANYAFLGAVSSTASLVTVTILGSDTEETADGYVPLAALTLPKPVQPFRLYAVEALAAGVGGWVAFGPGVQDTQLYGGRFGSPAQSRLTGRCAHAYQDLPVSSVGKRGSGTALTGLVRLRGGSDIEIFGACRRVPRRWPLDSSQECGPPLNSEDGRDYYNPWRRVIVIRLADTGRGSDNVLEKYIGPCDRRPESGTCEGLQPIETIGGVRPNCDGEVVIEFRGCAALTEIVEEVIQDESGDSVASVDAVGVIVDCALSLGDTCKKTDVPLPDGRLDNEVEDACIVSSIVLDEAPEIDPCEATKLISPRFDAILQRQARDTDRNFRITDNFDASSIGQTLAPPGWRIDGGTSIIVDGSTIGGVEYKWVRCLTAPFQCFYVQSGQQPANWHYKKTSVGCRQTYSARLVLGRRDGSTLGSDYHFVEFDRTGTVWGEVGLRIGVHEDGQDRTIHSQEILTLPPVTLDEEAESHLGFRIQAVVTPDPDETLLNRAWLKAELFISGRRL